MGASRNGLVGSFAVEFSDASCLPGLRSRLRQLIPAGDGRIDAELPDETYRADPGDEPRAAGA
ncbi:MAG: hypothetical protein V7633_5034 [Pseudonocardia sp.]|jgi:hypothetical protein